MGGTYRINTELGHVVAQGYLLLNSALRSSMVGTTRMVNAGVIAVVGTGAFGVAVAVVTVVAIHGGCEDWWRKIFRRALFRCGSLSGDANPYVVSVREHE